MNAVNFTNQWWVHNLTIDKLKDEFFELSPPHPAITFGTFNFGSGFLEIPEEFASFIVERIMRIENSL